MHARVGMPRPRVTADMCRNMFSRSATLPLVGWPTSPINRIRHRTAGVFTLFRLKFILIPSKAPLFTHDSLPCCPVISWSLRSLSESSHLVCTLPLPNPDISSPDPPSNASLSRRETASHSVVSYHQSHSTHHSAIRPSVRVKPRGFEWREPLPPQTAIVAPGPRGSSRRYGFPFAQVAEITTELRYR